MPGEAVQFSLGLTIATLSADRFFSSTGGLVVSTSLGIVGARDGDAETERIDGEMRRSAKAR